MKSSLSLNGSSRDQHLKGPYQTIMKKTDKTEKTNVCRLLDQKKIPYVFHTYPHGEEATPGLEVAKLTGTDPGKVFKTLVTVGAKGSHYVFVIPVTQELDLKKAAKAAGEKSISMLHVNDLLPLTGYIRGGCSPIGMKKLFPTFFDDSASSVSPILVSAGKIGAQVEVDIQDLLTMTRGKLASLT